MSQNILRFAVEYCLLPCSLMPCQRLILISYSYSGRFFDPRRLKVRIKVLEGLLGEFRFLLVTALHAYNEPDFPDIANDLAEPVKTFGLISDL